MEIPRSKLFEILFQIMYLFFLCRSRIKSAKRSECSFFTHHQRSMERQFQQVTTITIGNRGFVRMRGIMWDCRELEEWYRSDFTTQILETSDHLDGTYVLREAEKYIVQKDQTLILAEVSKYQHIQKITGIEIGWKSFGTKLYRSRPTRCQEHEELVESLGSSRRWPCLK